MQTPSEVTASAQEAARRLIVGGEHARLGSWRLADAGFSSRGSRRGSPISRDPTSSGGVSRDSSLSFVHASDKDLESHVGRSDLVLLDELEESDRFLVFGLESRSRVR